MTISRIPSVEGGIQPTLLTAKGDLISATAASTVARLPVGSDAQILVADSTASTGLKWATPASSSFPAFRAFPATDQTISASTFTKVLFASETFDTDNCFASSRFTPTTAGYYQLNVVLYTAGADANDFMYFYKNGSNYQTFHNAYSTGEPSLAMSNVMYLNGTTDYAEIYFYSPGCSIVSGTTISSFSGVGIRS